MWLYVYLHYGMKHFKMGAPENVIENISHFTLKGRTNINFILTVGSVIIALNISIRGVVPWGTEQLISFSIGM